MSPAETLTYTNEMSIGKCEANMPKMPAPASRNYLPGLRPIEIDVDVYFKEVFSGLVF